VAAVSTREHCHYNPTKKKMPDDDRGVNGGSGCRMKSCGTAFLLMRTVPLQPDEEKDDTPTLETSS